jgi:hypothetical protein
MQHKQEEGSAIAPFKPGNLQKRDPEHEKHIEEAPFQAQP